MQQLPSGTVNKLSTVSGKFGVPGIPLLLLDSILEATLISTVSNTSYYFEYRIKRHL